MAHIGSRNWIYASMTVKSNIFQLIFQPNIDISENNRKSPANSRINLISNCINSLTSKPISQLK